MNNLVGKTVTGDLGYLLSPASRSWSYVSMMGRDTVATTEALQSSCELPLTVDELSLNA